MSEFTKEDLLIIRATQNGLPLVPQPYAEIACMTGLPVNVVKSRIQEMLDKGGIRRIAAVPNHYRIGWPANGMTVWDVSDDFAETLGAKVGALDIVSHCYLRPRHLPQWPYNLFAMVHGKTREEVLEKANQIREILKGHIRQSDILFSRKILKKTGFRLPDEGDYNV